MINTPSMQDLLEAGVHFGHQVRRGHPKMAEYIFGVRDGVHVINLELSEKLLKEASECAYNLGKEGKVLLFIGTKKQAQPIISELAEKIGAFYVTSRWVGGTLTNFDEIRKNIKKLLDLKDKKEKGQLSHYTKKEQLLISRQIEKFDKDFGGIAKLESLPDVVFLADCVNERTALNESIRVELPIIGIVDTNANPQMVDYPIPGNDDATKSIKLLIGTIMESYGKGLKESGEKVAKEEKAKKEEKKEEVVLAPSIIDEVAVAEEQVEKASVQEASRVE